MRINNKERGSALVIVLGMLAVLMLMAVAFSIIMRVERAGTTNLRHSLTAQNGIQSAIAHAIRDIEKSVFHNVVPEEWEYGVMASSGDDVTYDILQSGDPSSDVKVSILTERAQRHLNPTTRALVKNAKVDWRLLYAGVPLSNYAGDGNRLEEDSIVGRIAYVAVNTTGYLDPNMVSETEEYAFPEETPQLNNTSFAKLGGRNVRFDSGYDFFDARKEDRRKGFSSFADLVSLNDSLMYNEGGGVKPAPKMFINLFAPDKANCMFLPDVFGPATALGLSPYPPQVERDSNEPFADEEYKLLEAVKIDGKTSLSEDDLIKVYVAFLNMFSREYWKDKSPSGTGGIEFDKPITNVPWEFIFSGAIKRNQITRADLALLSFAELYSYKKGNKIYDRTYAEMAVDIINEGGRPKFSDLLDAPCFMPVPTVSSLIGYTEKPDLKAVEVYRHTGGGSFSVVGDDAVIEAGKTTAEYYAKYELDVNFLISAATAYKIKSYPEAKMDVTLKFGPEADGEEIFKHIHEEITGNPKVVVDPDGKFARSVKGGIEFSESSSREGIRIEETLPEKIVVYIQHPKPDKTSTEENPITIASIKNDFSWEKASFDTSNLEKYSIDVFATVDIKVNGTVVQSVPGKKIRSRGDAEGAVHFKLPLYRDGGELDTKPHRVGYAMALDSRFAQSTFCLNEMRENGEIESFPYWVNNLMAENYSQFKDLEDFEKSVEKPADLDLGNRLRPSFANPYSMLSMGFDANGEGEGGASDFWDNLLRLGDIETEFGKPYPDTLHEAPAGDISLINDTGFDRNDFLMDWGIGGTGFDNLGELGMLCIGPWETISLYRTKTPEGKYDFHTVFDFFTMDTPTQLLPGKVNLNAPSLLMTQSKSPKRVKLAEGTSFANEGKLTIGGKKVSFADYVESTDGLNPEPLMAVLYGLGFDNYVAWEIASRLLYQNIDYSEEDKEGIYRFKDLSQLGYSNSADKSILEYIMDEDNEQIFVQADINPYSDSERESLIGKIAKHTTTRGQSFTIVIRSDAFAPKFGSDVDGTTLASKVAIVEAWRDSVREYDADGKPLKYHKWHIRSVRIVE